LNHVELRSATSGYHGFDASVPDDSDGDGGYCTGISKEWDAGG
jgi:hypothetical protein